MKTTNVGKNDICREKENRRKNQKTKGCGHLQCTFHLFECYLCLLEETVDNSLTEISFVFVVIHLQDLVKRRRVKDVLVIAEIWRTLLLFFLCCILVCYF
jgi:hypothetical protein